jgi:predicted RNA-binding protein YlxR (DUF448 family)
MNATARENSRRRMVQAELEQLGEESLIGDPSISGESAEASRHSHTQTRPRSAFPIRSAWLSRERQTCTLTALRRRTARASHQQPAEAFVKHMSRANVRVMPMRRRGVFRMEGYFTAPSGARPCRDCMGCLFMGPLA